MDTFTLILEIIGTIAFAASGAMIASQKKMDIFGVNVLGATTAVGGGMMRDVIAGVLKELEIEAPTGKDKGRIMKVLMPKVKGIADGKLVNQVLGSMMQ